MKKTLVALAALTAIAASAQTTTGKPGVEIQGNFNAGYQANSYKGVSVKGIDQNGAGTTAINIRGLEDMGGGMAAYFRVENDLSIMNNAGNQGVIPSYSNSSAAAAAAGGVNGAGSSTLQKSTSGVAGSWGNGELIVGTRGAFGDVAFGAINNAGLIYGQLTAAPTQGTSFGGGYGTVLGADPTMTTVRWANSFRYITPKVNGFEASYIKAFKQDNATVPVAASGVALTTTSLGVGLNNQVGADEIGIKYSQGPLNVAYVANKTSMASFCAAPSTSAVTNMGATGSAANNPCYSATTLGAGAISTAQDNKQSGLFANYDLGGGWLVSGAMQKTTLGQVGALTNGNQSDRSATFLNAQYTTGAHTVFASTGSVKENAANNQYNGNTSKFTGLGYNYALSKMTSLVARYEQFDDQARILPLTATTAYTSTQGTDSTNLKRVRSMFGLNVNF